MSDPFVTTGTTGASTVDDSAVELIRAVPNRIFKHLMVINNGDAVGFFKVGSGGEPVRIEKAIEAFDDVVIENEQVFIQRESGGTDMTKVFGIIW